MTAIPSTVDAEDVARFSRIAEEWWDENGKFKPLHRLGPVRVRYIRDRVTAHFSRDADALKALDGLSLLDIGCGGGLLCEPMTRMGATVTGIDASDKNIAVAKLHAEKMGLSIDYRYATAEELVARNQLLVSDKATSNQQPATSYDIVLALEIVEHVADVPLFLSSCAALVKPGGLLIMSTLNRTAKSFAMAIVGAEYVLRWLPRGTHNWKQFLKPSELCGGIRKTGMGIDHMSGMVFSPFANEWRLHDTDLDVNYLVCAAKPVNLES